MPRLFVCLLNAIVPIVTMAQPASEVAPEAQVISAAIGAMDRGIYRDRLLSLLQRTDIGDSNALYEAQQQGMSLTFAVFAFGSPDDQQVILAAAANLVRALPKTGVLAAKDWLSDWIATVELLSPAFTRARQRVLRLAFSVDGLPLPISGGARERRVFPIIVGDRINVYSEVELQFSYLLSTIVRVSVARPLPALHPLAKARLQAQQELVDFLMRDKVVFYWQDVPAWHWLGPFPSMRERVLGKLSPTAARLMSPPWYHAIVDHELHLFAIAADLEVILRDEQRLQVSARDRATLDEIRKTTLRVVSERVRPGFDDGGGFLFDYGLWSTNPSVAYAGCNSVNPLPLTPCPLSATATDSSHARRWPWWLNSFLLSWPAESVERLRFSELRRQLARQFTERVLYFDPVGRPLNKNYMDGVDGWYRFKESPSQQWGHGPSSMSGAMRYGSWGLLAPLARTLAVAQARMCDILISEDPASIEFRTRYYGSASTKPEMAGFGEVDLYGPGSLYALTCRIGQQFGLYPFSH